MTKKYKDAKEKKIKDLLTQQQIKEVDDTGDYIDTLIDQEVGVQDVGTTRITVPYCLLRFECDPDGIPLSYPENERQLMQSLLFTRIKDSGWQIQQDYDVNWIIYIRNF